MEILKLNNVCRICLQQRDEMVPLDDESESEVSICEKITLLTKIQLQTIENMKICSLCLSDLESGYRFIQNIQSSDVILRASLTYENNEEVLEEHELPLHDFYNYKSELYDESVSNEKEEAIEENILAAKQEAIESEGEIVRKSSRVRKVKLKKSEASTSQIHICEICANQYKYRHALETHMRRHRGEKPFSCEYCNRCFVIRFELKRHMRVHTKDKPYSCRYCDRKFSDFGSRIKHERSHTGERPYVCQTCGKTFAYSHVLTGHLLTHTGEKKHICNTCGKRFTKAHHLKSHNNVHLKQINKQNIIIQQQQSVDQNRVEQVEEIEGKSEDLSIVYI